MLLAVVTYAPLVRAGFIWDDESYVTNNRTLRTTDGLQRIWLDTTAVKQYYPLVHTTLWLEYHLWGLYPLGYHVVNVLLHAASAVSVLAAAGAIARAGCAGWPRPCSPCIRWKSNQWPGSPSARMC